MGKMLLCDNPFCREFELTDYDLIAIASLANRLDTESDEEENYEKILTDPCECNEEMCKELVKILERVPLMEKVHAYNEWKDALPYNETFGSFQDRISKFISYLQVCRGFTTEK